ncbi:uncharacterized protein LOC126784032 [Argentina anserina]|uniref:uncharacterized protein LOC126784032 n=1 Tax=Argentina anserina TaxID=57926 RepID=UPI0021763940|nr:uncharacterized protein LOC126784032 [Potentilla anserina]
MLSLTCHFTNSSISSLLVLAKVDNNQRGMKHKPMALIKLLCNTEMNHNEDNYAALPTSRLPTVRLFWCFSGQIHYDVVKTTPSKEENIKLKDEIGDKNRGP